jgi:hypothetical protein
VGIANRTAFDIQAFSRRLIKLQRKGGVSFQPSMALYAASARA